jgi:hypothetical protein
MSPKAASRRIRDLISHLLYLPNRKGIELRGGYASPQTDWDCSQWTRVHQGDRSVNPYAPGGLPTRLAKRASPAPGPAGPRRSEIGLAARAGAACHATAWVPLPHGARGAARMIRPQAGDLTGSPPGPTGPAAHRLLDEYGARGAAGTGSSPSRSPWMCRRDAGGSRSGPAPGTCLPRRPRPPAPDRPSSAPGDRREGAACGPGVLDRRAGLRA